MKELSLEQLEFLRKHEIELKYVFNAFGYTREEYKLIMKDLDKSIAFNVTPCSKGGHTLRTRSGHCCQCNTATIAYQRRADSEGVTYLAASKEGEIIKIGYTKAVNLRSESLNRTQYANYTDWEILFAIKSKFAGRIENAVNSNLHKYYVQLDYNHDGSDHDSHEIFQCSYSFGKEMILTICKEHNFDYTIIEESSSSQYEFRNLRRLNLRTSHKSR
jgi:hypothetical protein